MRYRSIVFALVGVLLTASLASAQGGTTGYTVAPYINPTSGSARGTVTFPSTAAMRITMATPATPTPVADAGSGSLAAGTYQITVVAVDPAGGVTLYPTAVATTTTGAGSHIDVGYVAPAGAVSTRVYVSAINGATPLQYFSSTSATTYALTTLSGATVAALPTAASAYQVNIGTSSWLASLILPAGGQLKTSTTSGDTFSLAGYTGSAYSNLLTVTNGATPALHFPLGQVRLGPSSTWPGAAYPKIYGQTGNVVEFYDWSENGFSELHFGASVLYGNITFGNGSARSVGIGATATDVVGRALTFAAGSTVAGTSVNDVVGGDLVLTSGLGTGAAANNIIFKTGAILASGKVLQTATTALTIDNAQQTILGNVAAHDRIIVSPVAKGANQFDGTLTSEDLTAAKTWTMPNATGIVGVTAVMGDSVTAPTIAAGGCSGGGTQAVTYANGTAAFLITQGSSTCSTTMTLTMPAAAHGWACSVRDTGGSHPTTVEPVNTTSVTVTHRAASNWAATNFDAGEVLVFLCRAY